LAPSLIINFLAFSKAFEIASFQEMAALLPAIIRKFYQIIPPFSCLFLRGEPAKFCEASLCERRGKPLTEDVSSREKLKPTAKFRWATKRFSP